MGATYFSLSGSFWVRSACTPYDSTQANVAFSASGRSRR